ncbi:MAG: nucleoside deaminase [Firmicutes bacterium]|nr:nucleoside deaminase [Bacillota bacterium]
MMKKYMKIALKEAMKAEKHGDVPIGAVIVRNSKIIAKGHNKKEKKQMVTRHAEIEAVEKACKKLKTWHLEDCEIYTTVEPCVMCYGAIEQARIKKIIYGVENDKFGYFSKNNDYNNSKIQSGVLRDDCKKIIQKFFLKKRG